MSLSFLPDGVKCALGHLNLNHVTEIRYRKGQPVIVGIKNGYCYLGELGIVKRAEDAIIAGDPVEVIGAATGGSVYNYTEQMKSGFITVEHGVRIGIAGEYVSDGNKVNTIKNITSLNIRIPHEIMGCADSLFNYITADSIESLLIFSRPGLGKTTLLREISKKISSTCNKNILILDERNEIAAMDGNGNGFDVGNADIIRCGGKISAIQSAIRAMKPDIIITDELYGEDDIKAVCYAADCNISVIASTHVCDREILKSMPFNIFAELTAIGAEPKLYDKNFNSYCHSGVNDVCGDISVCK